MACSKVYDWDWNSGEEQEFRLGSIKIPLNYFSCGTYFFDGVFQCVRFPKGMQLYHGSGALANANAEFPLGIDYYKTSSNRVSTNTLLQDVITHPDESVSAELSRQVPVKPAWFGTYNTAKLYSRQQPTFSKVCGDKCICVFRLKRDTVFVLLDNNFNIWRMINDPLIPDKAKEYLKRMFSLNGPVWIEAAKNEFGKIEIEQKKRSSYREFDLPFTDWLCSYLPSEYAGYAANVPVKDKQAFFHLEFMICNPLVWLERDLSSPKDWQHFNTKMAPLEVVKLLNQMRLYKSINIDFHSGDLFEHSIWSLLFAERLTTNTYFGQQLPVEFAKKIAATALLHDIGKMDPNNSKVSKRKSDYVYFSIKEHPRTGSDYILGNKQIPILDPTTLEQVSVINMPELLGELGFVSSDVVALAKVVDMHWEFGLFLDMWDEVSDKAVDMYINKVGNEPYAFFLVIVLVSVADVLASQPYGVNNLTAELNHHSRFFPYISNVPKKYRGGNLADITASKRKKFMFRVLEKVYAAKAQPQPQLPGAQLEVNDNIMETF